MKWKTSPPRYKRVGESTGGYPIYEKICFAFLPVCLDNGTTIWLEKYVWMFEDQSNWGGDKLVTLAAYQRGEP